MPRRISPLVLALVGTILFGDGAYIHAKAWLAQVLLERAFDRSIAIGQAVKPWSWADTWPVVRIEMKRIGASAIVLSGTSGQALAFGPGHLDQTVEAGERGVAVYAAHRDTHFRFLRNVAIGDVIEITRSDGKHFVIARALRAWCVSMHRASIPQRKVTSSCYRRAGRSTRSRPAPSATSFTPP